MQRHESGDLCLCLMVVFVLMMIVFVIVEDDGDVSWLMRIPIINETKQCPYGVCPIARPTEATHETVGVFDLVVSV